MCRQQEINARSRLEFEESTVGTRAPNEGLENATWLDQRGKHTVDMWSLKKTQKPHTHTDFTVQSRIE